MKDSNNISVVIAAAGKGSRSGLSFPKTLFEVNKKPIIVRLIDTTNDFDKHPSIIVSHENFDQIQDVLIKNNKFCNFYFQEKQIGMGNALLSVDVAKLNRNILLLWGDIPFIKKKTLKKIVKTYFEKNLDFILPTLDSENGYTKVVRSNNKVQSVLESKEESLNGFGQCERDIGVFLFKRDIIFKLLNEPNIKKIGKVSNEHGFLYIIEHLVKAKKKVMALKIAESIEALSLNTYEDSQNLQKFNS
tara:strand:- start:10956 stop:11693 length:738 start_codon:yes stop_codon:yes gene_type:complete